METEGLKFFTIKLSSGKFLSFAYDENKIVDAILNATLSIDQINKVYFSQIELKKKLEDDNETCVKIDNVCLGLLDDKIIQVPTCFSNTITNNIDISNIVLSKSYFFINKNSKYINNENITKLSIMFTLLFIVLIIKIFINYQTIAKYEDNIKNIKIVSKMPSSIIQTKSIIKKYQRTYNKQNKIRDGFAYIFHIKKTIGAIVINVEFKNKTYKCTLKNITVHNAKVYFKKNYTVNRAKKTGDFVIVEFRL